MVFKPHFISTDTYKLKVEKTIKGVLGRPGGVEGGGVVRIRINSFTVTFLYHFLFVYSD